MAILDIFKVSEIKRENEQLKRENTSLKQKRANFAKIIKDHENGIASQ